MSSSIKKYISHRKIAMVLEYFIKYVGSSALDAPGMMGLLFAMQMRYGLWYVKGGMKEISHGLIKLANEQSVKLYKNSEVKKITLKDCRTSGIVLTDGRSFQGDLIVSNHDYIPTHEQLLEQALDKKIVKKLRPSCSGLVVHLGLNKEYSQLAHHNFFYSKDQNTHFKSVFQKYEIPKDPTLYVVAPSRSDKNICPHGHDVVKILPHIPPISENNQNPDYEDSQRKYFYQTRKNGP